MKNKLLLGVAFLTVANILFFVGGDVVINKIADRVVEKLKRYSPSPYGPAFDPDKINFNRIQEKIVDFPQEQENVSWRQNWEKERGFNPEQ